MITLNDKEKEFIKTKLKPYLQRNDLKSVVQLCINFSGISTGYNVPAFLLQSGIPLLKSIDKIPSGLFSYSDLENIHIPSNIKSINKMAFCRTKLKYIDFDEGVESFGEQAFSEIRSLKTMKLPNSLKRIDRLCFNRSQLEELYLPDSITVLQPDLFDGGNDNIIIYANSRKNLPSNQKLKCPEAEVEWYKEHLKLNPTSGGNDE